VPRSCQNGRETAATGGHPRAPRTASDLGTRRLTRCVKRPSKQQVAGETEVPVNAVAVGPLDAVAATLPGAT